MFKQTTNEIVNVRVKNQLFEDYDIFVFINKGNEEKAKPVLATLKGLNVLDKVEIIHHESEYKVTGRHFVVFEKGEVNLKQLKNEDFKVHQIFKEEIENVIALNICLMMLTGKSKDIPNLGFYRILEATKNQFVTLKLRFEQEREGLGNKLYLSPSLQTFTNKTFVNDDVYRPFYIGKGGKMVRVTNNYEGEKYVQRNPFDMNSYSKFIIPRGDKKYDRDAYVKSSVFGVMIDILGRRWKEELDDYISFEFKKENVERYENHKAFDKIKSQIEERFKLMDINFVSDIEHQEELKNKLEELFSKRTKKGELEIEINSWSVSDRVVNGYNIVLVETGKKKKSDEKTKKDEKAKFKQEKADKLYQETKNMNKNGCIIQHLVQGNENKESILTCLEELLIKESLLKNKLPDFMQGILPDNKEYIFYLTTRHNEEESNNLYHKIIIKNNHVDYVTNQTIIDEDEMAFFNMDFKTIVDENRNAIRIYETKSCAFPDFDKLNSIITEGADKNNVKIPLSYIRDRLEEAPKSKTLSKIDKENALKLIEKTPDLNLDLELPINVVREKYFKKRTDINKKDETGCSGKSNFSNLFDFVIGEDITFHLQAKTEDGIDGLYPSFIDVSYNDDKYMVATGHSLSDKMHRAILVRRYEVEGENFFEEILPSFYVPFVRRNSLTVYPFVFKLLREAIELENVNF